MLPDPTTAPGDPRSRPTGNAMPWARPITCRSGGALPRRHRLPRRGDPHQLRQAPGVARRFGARPGRTSAVPGAVLASAMVWRAAARASRAWASKDVAEGRPVLAGQPTAFHVDALEHRGVELLAGVVAGLGVGIAATGGERRCQFEDLLPFAEVAGDEPGRWRRWCRRPCAPARSVALACRWRVGGSAGRRVGRR